MARSSIHAALFGGLVMILAACSTFSTGSDGTRPASESGERTSAGVATGEACGGMTGAYCLNASDYCHYEPADQCGAADRMGTCRARPEVCTREYRPVCGCDGQTHPNPCEANAAGTSIASEGPCEG